MSKIKKRGGIVYSTDPNFNPYEEEIIETLPNEKQKLRVRYEKAGRGGKEASIITGFIGNEFDLKELATQLKQSLGCGGSQKNNEIIIQGNKKEKIIELLKKWGYKDSK